MSAYTDPPPLPAKAKSSSSTAVIILIVVVVVFFCGAGVVALLTAMLLPAVSAARNASRSMADANAMKMVGLAMHEYHAAYNCLPAPTIDDATGKPMHSWRTALLPYVEQDPLFNQYNFDQPWDSTKNRALGRQAIPVYRSTQSGSNGDSSTANVIVVTGKGTCFEKGRWCKFRDMTDGQSQVAIAFMVPGVGVPWSSPRDMTLPELRSQLAATPANVRVIVLMGDGSTHAFTANRLLPILDRLVLRSDGQPIAWPQ